MFSSPKQRDEQDSPETASLADVKAAGSRSAAHIVTLQNGAVGLASLSAVVEAVNQASETVSKITTTLGTVNTQLQATAETAHGFFKLIHPYLGAGTLIFSLLVAVIAFRAGRYLLDAYHAGRYQPRASP